MAPLAAPLLSCMPPSHHHAQLHSFTPSPNHKKLDVLCSASASSLSGSPESWHISIPDQPTSNKPSQQQRRRAKQIAGVDQTQLVDPWLLADPDSRFADFYGVQIHYKIAHPMNDHPASEASESVSQSTAAPPAILLHGFGASVFSWERVLQPLANLLRSKVVAFDRPAFGLTSRIRLPLARSPGKNVTMPVHLNPYSVGFSSSATTAFIDLLQSDKAILIGHSAGCIIAADACIRAPERVAALVMVAPAIIAPLIIQRQLLSTEEEKQRERSDTTGDKWRERFFLGSLLSLLWRSTMLVVNKLVVLFSKVKEFATFVWCRMLGAVLRSQFAIWLLQTIMDRCSLQAVHSAWYDREKVDQYVIEGYTRPLRCRDWEQALLEHVAALVADPIAGREKGLSQHLGEISCPVLIITGDKDQFVPAWNAERLAKALPKAQCRVIKNCGHLPHEEKPGEFLAIIQDFMQCAQQEAVGRTTGGESAMWVAA